MITIGRVDTVLRRQWGMLAPGEPPPTDISFMMLTKGVEPVGKVVLLAFLADECRPRFVLKLARLKEHNPSIRNEYENLRLIAAHGRHGCVLTPESLLCWEDEGRLCLIETVVEGVDLRQANLRSRSVAFVAPIVEWLIHLSRVTAGGRSAAPAEDVTASVAHAAHYIRTEQERRVLDAVVQHLRALPAAPLPRVFEHADMGTWNVTVSREGHLGILDWESSRPDGLPARDLFYFLAHYGFMMHASRTPSQRLVSFTETFLRQGPFARIAIEAIHRYTDALRLSPAWLGPLFLICWLRHATAEVDRVGTGLTDSFFWRMLTLALDHDCRLNFLEAS